MRIKLLFLLLASFYLTGCSQQVRTVWLDELDITKATSSTDAAQVNKSIGGNPITMNSEINSFCCE